MAVFGSRRASYSRGVWGFRSICLSRGVKQRNQHLPVKCCRAWQGPRAPPGVGQSEGALGEETFRNWVGGLSEVPRARMGLLFLLRFPGALPKRRHQRPLPPDGAIRGRRLWTLRTLGPGFPHVVSRRKNLFLNVKIELKVLSNPQHKSLCTVEPC